MNTNLATLEPTMSSREIADLVGRRHDNVKRTMENLSAGSLISFTHSEETSHSGAGARPVVVYLVGQRDSYVVVAQLSPEFTSRLVDRWRELEAAAATRAHVLPDFANPAAAARAWAEQYERSAQLESRVAEQAPKVAALERFATETKGSYSLREAAKSLQVKSKKFVTWLLERRWIYRHPDGGRWLAFQPRLDSGMLEHKVVTGQRNDGTDWGTTQVRVTAKGLARIAELLERDRAGVPA